MIISRISGSLTVKAVPIFDLRRFASGYGMAISLFSFFEYIHYLFDAVSDTRIGSVFFAAFSMLFYFIDAIISLVKGIKKIDPRFNYMLALVLIGGIPMVVFFGGDGKDFFNVIWNIYYLMMFVLEVISIKKAFAAMKAGRDKVKNP